MALAAGLVSASWGLPAHEGAAAVARKPLLRLVQALANDDARVTVAGERLSVRSAPKGNSPIVNHVEKGKEVIVVQSQSPWAKIEDYDSGRVLGWVYESLLVDPGG